MPNRTVYIGEDNEPVWDEAQRLLPFYQDKSLSAVVVERYGNKYGKRTRGRRNQQRVVSADAQRLAG